jgi:hypothetical protein
MDNKKENRRLAVFRLGSLLYLLLTLLYHNVFPEVVKGFCDLFFNFLKNGFRQGFQHSQ